MGWKPNYNRAAIVQHCTIMCDLSCNSVFEKYTHPQLQVLIKSCNSLASAQRCTTVARSIAFVVDLFSIVNGRVWISNMLKIQTRPFAIEKRHAMNAIDRATWSQNVSRRSCVSCERGL